MEHQDILVVRLRGVIASQRIYYLKIKDQPVLSNHNEDSEQPVLLNHDEDNNNNNNICQLPEIAANITEARITQLNSLKETVDELQSIAAQMKEKIDSLEELCEDV